MKSEKQIPSEHQTAVTVTQVPETAITMAQVQPEFSATAAQPQFPAMAQAMPGFSAMAAQPQLPAMAQAMPRFSAMAAQPQLPAMTQGMPEILTTTAPAKPQFSAMSPKTMSQTPAMATMSRESAKIQEAQEVTEMTVTIPQVSTTAAVPYMQAQYPFFLPFYQPFILRTATENTIPTLPFNQQRSFPFYIDKTEIESSKNAENDPLAVQNSDLPIEQPSSLSPESNPPIGSTKGPQTQNQSIRTGLPADSHGYLHNWPNYPCYPYGYPHFLQPTDANRPKKGIKLPEIIVPIFEGG